MANYQERLELPMIWGKARDGCLHPYYFHLCTVDNLAHLEALFFELANAMAEATLYQSFPTQESLYVNCEKVRVLCHEILKLNGINPQNHNVSQIVELCIGGNDKSCDNNQDSKPEPKKAILLELNFLSQSDKPVKNTDEQINMMRYIAKLEGDIIASKLMTATETRQMFSEKPLDYIISMFESMLESNKNNPAKPGKNQSSHTEPVSDDEFRELHFTGGLDFQSAINNNIKK